ncbi:YdeI/OmpD-associated family protein [Candidatus Acetothermia bacterium]|nr:YdeI/OmpD-associated family protein [Candidatus Acetothermia bacterium]MBI3643291.1 YdeI/OmpD-associated family protein [Candidatus Acetothermia bacterium]
MNEIPKAKFFRSQAQLHAWFVKNHTDTTEVWIGFYKKGSDKKGVSYSEAVDEALSFGWIDGIMKSIDEISYANRFTPRRARSNWSEANIKRVAELRKLGRMQPSGLKAFQMRDAKKPAQYSYEKSFTLDSKYLKEFKKNKSAWASIQAQSATYQRSASWWVMSAKREETRLRRLAILIADSENGRRIRELTRPVKPK